MRRTMVHAGGCLLLALAACGDGATDDDEADAAAGPAGADSAGGGAGGVDAAPSGILYDQAGPLSFTVIEEHVDEAGHAFDATVYLPEGSGPHPVVVHACGSSQIAAGYVPYGERLASYGIAMVLLDDPGALVNTSDIFPSLTYAVETWLPARFPGVLDPSRVGLSGHSRGGAVSLLAAERGLRGLVTAWFGLDPVDNQFGLAPGDYARTNLADIGIPTAFLGAEVTSNCAPTADSYPTLFPLAPSPKALIVGKGAGHTQLQLASACNLCSICSPDGTADPDVVLAYAVRYFTAFFARELQGDASVGPHFEGAGGPEDVTAGLVTVL